MKSRRTWWFVYGAGVVVVVLALAWVTATVVRLERAELDARAEAAHQEALRLALWRMDSWLAPQLAREAARPVHEYQAFFAQQEAYTRMLSQIEPGEVLTPSPLLSFASDYIRLHFQVGPDGVISSPQAPTGNLRELAEIEYISGDQLATNDVLLGGLRQTVTPAQIEHCTAVATTQWLDEPEPPVPDPPPATNATKATKTTVLTQKARAQQEFDARQKVARNYGTGQDNKQVGYGLQTTTDFVGPLAPLWSKGPRDGDPDELLLVRQVQWQGQLYQQGFLCDWPQLREGMLAEIADLFPEAALAPDAVTTDGDRLSATMLATIPVSLIVAGPPRTIASPLSPARSTMALTWLVVLGAVAAAGVALRASFTFGDKRSRFASAVTHELRTPLTTFRMYTEMLAEGMVRDDEKRQRYLETLQDESGRLSRLVENVLCYARLEDGRHTAHVEPTSIESMLERVTPPLQRRVEETGQVLRIECDAPADDELTTDVNAVEQILFNLVDNACKYAPARGVELAVQRVDGLLRLEVRDHGPGVPAAQARTIFTPFERGDHHANGDAPGIGLGLSLARQLARELGGELSLGPGTGAGEGDAAGACFRLELPL